VSGPVLVTGATGFIGSQVVGSLRAAGRPVRCTYRRSSDRGWLDGVEVEWVEADLRRPDALQAAVRGASAVIHVAGVTRVPRPELFRRVNAEGTARLGEAAAEHGVRRFVYVSSLAARGPDGAEGPVSDYGSSKREGEERLRGMADRLDVVVLRPAGVYGPRDRDLLPLFRAAARGWLVAPAGGPVLQPIYVEDVARAVLRALDSDPGFGPFPLAEATVYDWPSIAEGMGAALGRHVRLVTLPTAAFVAVGGAAEFASRAVRRAPPLDRRRARDVAQYRWTCDPGPSEEALAWRARVALPEGLRRSVEWYVREGWV
jgi:nucleoside-diphosphate-sugar epimerase